MLFSCGPPQWLRNQPAGRAMALAGIDHRWHLARATRHRMRAAFAEGAAAAELPDRRYHAGDLGQLGALGVAAAAELGQAFNQPLRVRMAWLGQNLLGRALLD